MDESTLLSVLPLALLLFLSIVSLCIGLSQQKLAKRLSNEKRLVKGVVAGYSNDSSNSWTTLMVKLLDRDNGLTYGVKSGRIKSSDYPPGKTVDIWYLESKTLGISTPELRLVAAPPTEPEKVALAFFIIAGIFLLAMVVYATFV